MLKIVFWSFILCGLFLYILYKSIKTGEVTYQDYNKKYKYLVEVHLLNGLYHQISLFSNMKFDKIDDLLLTANILINGGRTLNFWKQNNSIEIPMSRVLYLEMKSYNQEKRKKENE